ncbi:hypothetical protein DRN58_06655 [Thermococci archaeon]|nr:MAG: hypothetical protein DRN58_06655 [Thermococci archaeon]
MSTLYFLVGVFLCYLGWKITAVTIVRSSLNDFGFFLICAGILVSHLNTVLEKVEYIREKIRSILDR